MTSAAFGLTLDAEQVVGALHLPDRDRSPCVVACHGMGASKDSDKYLALARELPASGLALARFDFRGSGESGGHRDRATIRSRIDDLCAVLDHLARRAELDGRFGLLGSSLGGYVALWAAAERGGGMPVVTWNAPASLRDLGATHGSAPEGPGAALVAEVRAGRHTEAPAGVSHVLVVQGDQDETVPPRHARLLLARAASPKQIHVIAGADHRLSDPAHRAQALGCSRAWLVRHLL